MAKSDLCIFRCWRCEQPYESTRYISDRRERLCVPCVIEMGREAEARRESA